MGFDQLYGTDFSTVFIESAMKRDGIVVRQGTAENIPFDPSFDVLVSDQVVEHLFDPNKIFLEARRILKDNGYLCISVPNSSVYSDHYFFDFYWVLMREHVHHFDDTHLISLAEKHGFSFQEMLTSVTPFLNDTTTLPTITLVFKYDKIVRPIRKSFELKQSISKYFDEGFHKLADRCQTLNKTIAKTTKLYLFGMSRELMYLYANSDLSKYNVCGIIDDTPSKQACTFNGIRIYSSDIIKELPEDAVILITAFAHKEVIRQKIATTFKGLVL
jgi:SAM-dependent methyltransferase